MVDSPRFVPFRQDGILESRFGERNMRKNTFALLAFLALLGLCLGCGAKDGGAAKDGEKGGGDKGGAAAAPAEPKEGGSTPEKAFNGLKDTMADGKMKGAMLKWIAPDERYSLVFGMFFGAAMMAGFDEKLKPDFEALAKKHKLPLDLEGENEFNMEDMNDKAKVRAFASKLFKDTTLAALFDDLAAIMEKGDGGEGKEKTPTGVKDIKIEGDKAKGTMSFSDGKSEPIHFVKIDGAWFVVMDADDEEGGEEDEGMEDEEEGDEEEEEE
jgi:hypothetical protein